MTQELTFGTPQHFSRNFTPEQMHSPLDLGEQILLQRLANDDRAAFWPLWQQHKPYLFRCCQHWMNNKEDADDALSEIMLRAWEKMQSHAARINNPKAWLTQLGRNLCINMRAKRQTYSKYVQNCGEMDVVIEQLVTDDLLPEDLLLSREMSDTLFEAIADLPSRLHETARLRFLEEMPDKDIATRQAISLANVHKRIQQARPLLQKSISLYQAGEQVVRRDERMPKKDNAPAVPIVGRRAVALEEAELQPQTVATFGPIQVNWPSGIERTGIPVCRTFILPLRQQPTRQEQKLKTWEEYVDEHPNGWKTQLKLADLLYDMGRWQEAIATYREVLTKQPRQLSVYVQVGNIYHLLSQKEEAIAVYEEALSYAYQEATQHHLRGLMAHAYQQYEASVTAFEAASVLQPHNPAHWHALGVVHLEQEAHQKALQAFDAPLELNPDDIYALTHSYEPLIALGQQEQAQERLDRVRTLARHDFLALKRLIEIRLQQGLVWDEAGKQTKKLIRSASRTPSAYSCALLAQYHIQRGKTKQGISVLKKFAKQHPDHPSPWYHYALSLFDTGDAQSAADAILNGLTLCQNDRQINRAAREICSAAGRQQEL